jgi:bacteriorhodopsin
VTETTWFWIGVVGMALGAAVISLKGGRRSQDEEAHTILHGIVCVIAACSYFSMAIGQGGIEREQGRIFWFARYVDWSVTTPLLLLGLAITALHGAHRRRTLVAAVLGADVLMIVTGLFSGLSADPVGRWVWYVISCASFVVVYLVLFGPLRREARTRDHERSRAYGHHVTVLAVLWLIYPIVVALGPDGSGVWSSTVTTACIAVVDLLAKVGYGLLSIADAKRITDSDLEHGELSPVAVTTHGVPSDAGQTLPTP